MTKSIYITVKCYTKNWWEKLRAEKCVDFTCSQIVFVESEHDFNLFLAESEKKGHETRNDHCHNSHPLTCVTYVLRAFVFFYLAHKLWRNQNKNWNYKQVEKKLRFENHAWHWSITMQELEEEKENKMIVNQCEDKKYKKSMKVNVNKK